MEAAGFCPASCKKYFVRVQVQDGEEQSSFSEPAFFVTAVIKQDQWKAQFITAEGPEDKDFSGSTYLRKEIEVSGEMLEAYAWRALFKSLLGPVCRRKDEMEAPEGVQVISRIWQGKSIYFLFNFSGQEKTVCIPEGKLDFLTKEKLLQEIILEQNGFKVIV